MRDHWEESESEGIRSLDQGMIGRPFRDVFPRAVRQQYHKLMGDLRLDLMFVADGVRFSGVRQVLLTLFELHDVYGGEQSAQEHHFAGLHNVRVLIQDVHGGSAAPKVFREPDYAEIGRARILMLVPNRGGFRWQAPVHAPSDRVPAPAR